MFERKQSVLGRKMMESGLSCLQFTHSNRLDLNEGFFLQSRSECPPGLQSRSTMLKAVFYKHHGATMAPPIQVELLLIRAFNQEQGGKVDARSFGGTRLRQD